MKTRTLLLAMLLGLAVGLAVGVYFWRARTAAAVAAVIPATPAFTEKQSLVREQVAAAEQQARSTWKAKTGLVELSRVYHANGFLAEASQCYDGLQQLDPENPRWPHLQATILAGYGQVEPALGLWRRVVALAPDYVPAHLRIGDAELKRNRTAEAAAAYQEAARREPHNAYALLGLARIDFEAERWGPAQQKLERLVEQTQYALGYDLIVSLYENTGQTERARAIRGTQKASGAYRDPADPWVDDMMEACLDPFRLALTAGAIARLGDAKTAVRLLERAIELAPDEIPARFQLGTLAQTEGNLRLAREQFDACTRISPGFPDGWVQLSAVQEQLGEGAAAARTLATGLEKNPTSPGLHLLRARGLQKAGHTTAAITAFRESIRLRPNEAQAYIELANVRMTLGQVDEGMALLHQAIEAEPGNPTALAILAYHAITVGDQPAAKRWCGQVHQQPRVPTDKAQQLWTAYRERFGQPPW